jgi:hypothetical protein
MDTLHLPQSASASPSPATRAMCRWEQIHLLLHVDHWLIDLIASMLQKMLTCTQQPRAPTKTQQDEPRLHIPGRVVGATPHSGGAGA